jgi:hypothetical protein
VGTDSTSVNVTFTAGDPDTIYVEFIPDTSSVGSPLLGKVTGSVKDALGNPVGSGTLLHLSLSDYERAHLATQFSQLVLVLLVTLLLLHLLRAQRRA